MKLNLRNPLAIFDLETTGTNVTRDRIVEMSIVKAMPDGSVETKTLKINPTIPIPLETSMIHGIYDKDVKDAPTFKDISKELEKYFDGCDLGGFNAIKFDIPMLVEEFLRSGIEFEIKNRKLVDAQKIFHLMEKRNLSAAYKFYCGKTLEGAHSAEADTVATYEILKAQVEKYNGQMVEDNLGNPISTLENNIDSLHKVSSSQMVDLAGRFRLNAQGVEVFAFGKHANKPVEQVLEKEPSYYDWMMRGDFPLDTKRRLTEIKLRKFGQNR
ncbi:MAG: 3'-5' exonuclease [Cyclobacteriaceae bacterium]|nr:3'-5' exonuclease [Cyclobacteriaceae bacterium]MCH8514705.1 3'-5' exonuclease [Cyclobacteriaceae bacterium]